MNMLVYLKETARRQTQENLRAVMDIVTEEYRRRTWIKRVKKGIISEEEYYAEFPGKYE